MNQDLRDQVRALDGARSAAAQEQERSGLEVWTALVEGRSSLVAQFDSDGRRFVVAQRNAPDLGPQLALTEREGQVAKLHAMGHASKYVGYELGLAPATVSEHLKSVLRKLGIRTKGELVRLYDELVG